MSSSVRISVISDTWTATQLRGLVVLDAERSVSLGEPIPPLSPNDTRERSSNFSSLSWRLDFVDDGSEALAALFRDLDIRWEEFASSDSPPSWVVAVILDGGESGDQVVVEPWLLDVFARLNAEFYVKVV